MKKTAVALTALLLTSGFAAADDRAVFRYAASDLTTLEGIATTHDRIEAAARSFCRAHLKGTRDLGRAQQCLATITNEIVASIGDTRLTAYSKTGGAAEEPLAQR